jgi:pseudouridine synthase
LEEIRLQKILAQAGIASRRKAEKIILAGRVAVNGIIVTELGAKATLRDKISVDGVSLSAEKKLYIALHKPEGVLTTVSDPHGRPTVMDFVPDNARLFPVGRLDFDTSGLLLLTNDGDWANNLTHPKFEIEKTYIAQLRGEPSPDKLETFRTGIKIDGKLTAPCEIICKREKYTTEACIVIHEGRNRQVRKMCDAIGHPVISLKRVSVGKIKLGDLQIGKWRHLTEDEANRG